jgi:hypothetical protein
MPYHDYWMCAALNSLRIDQARRGAKTQRRVRPGWMMRQGCWLLCQLGHLLVALGQRLQGYGPARPAPLSGSVGSS